MPCVSRLLRKIEARRHRMQGANAPPDHEVPVPVPTGRR
jgi:hypothetical protein